MENIGLRGMIQKLISSILSMRKIRVRVGEEESEDRTISQGVPQGSALGPLLFLLYINDISDHIRNFKFLLYADDTTCIFKGKDRKELLMNANIGLATLTDWMKRNDLIVNYGKTKCMIFGEKKGEEAESEQLDLIMDGQKIARVNSFCLLGLWIDTDLKWRTQVAQVANKMAWEIGRMRRIASLIDNVTVLKQLYYALIYPKISYGIVLWGNESQCRMNVILLLQKRCMRVILRMTYFQPVLHLFQEYGILTCREIYYFKTAILMYKIQHRIIHMERFVDLFTEINRIHSHNTRISRNLYTIEGRTKQVADSLAVKGVQIWNAIPPETRAVTSVPRFRSLLMEHIRLMGQA